MIRLDGRSRRGPQMSATPDSTLDDLRQINADLQQRIAANHAEHEVLKLALRESDERYALAMRAINEGFYNGMSRPARCTIRRGFANWSAWLLKNCERW